MQSKLTADFFTNNRRTLRTKLSAKLPVVIAGNGLLQRTGDSTLVFAQDSSFWYLTGLNIPDVVLVIDENDEFLIIPGRSAVREAFDGATDINAVSQNSGIEMVLNETDGWRRLSGILAAKKQASYLKPLSIYETRHGFYANPARRRVADKLRRVQSKLILFDARTELAELRCIKQPIEIELIKDAVRITKETLADITSGGSFGAMRYEYELEAAITCGFRKRGATGHAYNPIVASGKNATTLHYDQNNLPIESSDYIVVDVGAEVEHYAADITRTLIQDKPSERQKTIFEAVHKLQAEAIAMLKPGILMHDYEHRFEQLMATELKQLGLITNTSDRHSIRHYYPHATSHFLGLDVHDTGDYSKPLAENMVLTCEPGIYIPEEHIGVRIEDDLVITATGARVL